MEINKILLKNPVKEEINYIPILNQNAPKKSGRLVLSKNEMN